MKKFSISKSDVKVAFSVKKIHFSSKSMLSMSQYDPVYHSWPVQWSLDRVMTGHWWPKFQISRHFCCFSVLTRSVSLRCNFSCEYLQLREKKFWEKREDFCWFLFGVVDEEVFFRVWHHHVTWSHPLSWRCRDASLVGRDIVIPHQHHTGKWRNTNHRLIYIENWKIQSKNFW